MIRKLNQLVGLILATKLMTWAVPDTKKFIKGILIAGIIILITIYLHSEYLSWSEISGNSKFITISYIFKNAIILISIVSLYFFLKKPSKKIYPKVKGEEKIYSKYTNEDYFNKFREKEKLKTKAEQILEKDGKD